MTNKEAIVRINNLIKIIKSPRSIVPYCPEEMEALDLAIKVLEDRQEGKWIDHSEDYGYVECPFCEYLTNCEGNIDELHYCWNCGAKLEKRYEKGNKKMKINSERIIERLNYRMDISKDLQGPLGDGYRLAVIQMLDAVKQEEIFAKEMQDLEDLKAQLEKEGKI